MGKKTESVLRLLSNKPFVQGALVLALIFALANPLGLPIKIDPMSKKVYDIMENLKPNSKILYVASAPTGTMGDLIPQSVPLIYHLMRRGNLKLFFIGIGESADHIMIYIDSEVFKRIGYPEKYGLVYGEDWVNLGYVAGREVSYENFANDVQGTILIDREGNRVAELPMFEDVHTMADFDLVIYNGEKSWMPIQYWTEKFHKPLIVLTHTAMLPIDVIPWYTAGQITAYLCGVRSGADYEVLVDRPGGAVAALDALSISHLFLISLILLGNITYMVEKIEGKEAK